MTPAEITALLSTAEILELQEQGHRAALAGARPGQCPHVPRHSGDAQGHARRILWLRGHAAGRSCQRRTAYRSNQ